MTFKYPKTVEAGKRSEHSQWGVGDAALAECGPPGGDSAHNGGYSKIREAQAELASIGIDLHFDTLRGYRDASFRFPPGTRVPGVSHRVHIECGNPEMLHAILVGVPEDKDGKKTLPLHECSRLMKELRRRQSAENATEYNDRHNTAKSKVETVEKHVEAAKQAEAQATTLDDRRKAKEAKERVKRELEKAREDLHNVPKRPKGNPLTPPRPDQVPGILLTSQLMGAAFKAKALAGEATKLLEDASPRTFDLDSIGAVIEAALEAADKWREFAKLLQTQYGAKGSHLNVVGGE